jgi:hypothetical protein
VDLGGVVLALVALRNLNEPGDEKNSKSNFLNLMKHCKDIPRSGAANSGFLNGTAEFFIIS